MADGKKRKEQVLSADPSSLNCQTKSRVSVVVPISLSLEALVESVVTHLSIAIGSFQARHPFLA